jgi:hypothetical protein
MDPKGQEVRTEPKDGSTDGAGSVAEASQQVQTEPKGQEVQTKPKDGSTDGAGSVAGARKYRRQQDGDYGGL